MRLIGILFILFIGMQPVQASEGLDWVKVMPTLDCEARWLTRNMCIVTRAKDFSDQEIVLVRERIEKLQGLYPRFFKKILEKTDSVEFFRHTYGARRVSSHSFRQDRGMGAWVIPGRKMIHLPDKFFEKGFNITETHDSIDYLLIHELSHILDQLYKKVSTSEEFLTLFSWVQAPTGETYYLAGEQKPVTRWQTMGVPFGEIDSIREEVVGLYEQGKSKEGAALSLEFGQSHGHPGSYSMINPHENFAEVVVSYFMDPPTLVTAPDGLKTWLDSFFNN